MKILGVSFMLMDCGSELAAGWIWRGKRKVISIRLPWQLPIPYRMKKWLRSKGWWWQ